MPQDHENQDQCYDFIKIVSPKIGLFAQHTVGLRKKNDRGIGFQEKRQIIESDGFI
jgi:hypothetical protein